MSTSRTRPEGSSGSSIIRAARNLFLEKGYDGVNLDAIARAAGCARQTLYNNFGNKEAILKAVLTAHWRSLSESAALDGHGPGEDQTADRVLRDFAIRMLDFVEKADQVEFTRLIIAESRRLPWIGEEFYRLGKRPLFLALVGKLEELTQRGLLSCTRPDIAAHQFFGLIQEMSFWPSVMATGAATEGPSPEEIVEEAIRTFLARYAAVPAA